MAYWIILNGAPKCGSTWLTQLVKATKVAQELPEDMQMENWSSSSISPKKISCMLEMLTTRNDEIVYFTKQHWSNPWEADVKLALQHRNVIVCNIYRDARDMIVSRYFHDKRLGKTSLDLRAYLDSNLKSLLARSYEYHYRWLNWAEKENNNERYIFSSYEALSDDLAQYGALFLDSILKRVNRTTGQESLVRMAETTHFSKKKNTGDQSFFRKGVAFGWNEYLTDDQNEATLRICAELGYRPLKLRMIACAPHVAEHVRMTDVGC